MLPEMEMRLISRVSEDAQMCNGSPTTTYCLDKIMDSYGNPSLYPLLHKQTHYLTEMFHFFTLTVNMHDSG